LLGHSLDLTCFVVGTSQGIGNYVGTALNLGLSETTVKEMFFHLNFYTGLPQSGGVTAIVKEVLKSN
jgi:alkylhydroperoxidase/carboxymuconolactone decarboxylase family protein YurZ